MTTRDTSLQGTWIVTSYRQGEVMVDLDDRTRASLTIDGTLVSGNMGINRFSGAMEGDLPKGPFATTRMAGPPGLMRQENDLLAHLDAADTIHVGDDGMNFSSDGLLLMRLKREGTAKADPPS